MNLKIDYDGAFLYKEVPDRHGFYGTEIGFYRGFIYYEDSFMFFNSIIIEEDEW